MYVGVDIGGTKTFVACLDDQGVIKEQVRFVTPHNYAAFLRELAKAVAGLSTKSFIGGCIAVPGRINRTQGVVVACGNLPWHEVPIKHDAEQIIHCPVLIENDANLAGLSEAMLLKGTFSRVLYVTISTGIGTGFIVDQAIDPAVADSEGGHIEVEYQGTMQPWESISSGHAIVATFGKRAQEIADEPTWRKIAHLISLGLIDLIAMLQPQVVVIGGGVGTYFNRFADYLNEELKNYETPLVPIPPIREAQRPEEAVVYGCYDLIRSTHAVTR